MSKLSISSFSSYLIASMCSLSALMGPLQAQPFEYYPPQDEQETCNSCCWTGCAAPLIGGAVVLGGLALLAADHHRDGSTGPRGHTGPGFEDDSEETLTFVFPDEHYSITVGGGSLTSVTVVPFVVDPSGDCFEGDPLVATTNPNDDFTLPDIEVDNPVYGNYRVGFKIIVELSAGAEVDAINSQLRVDVVSSRDDSVTTTLENNLNFSDSTVPFGNEFQVTTDYSYCPEGSHSETTR